MYKGAKPKYTGMWLIPFTRKSIPIFLSAIPDSWWAISAGIVKKNAGMVVVTIGIVYVP